MGLEESRSSEDTTGPPKYLSQGGSLRHLSFLSLSSVNWKDQKYVIQYVSHCHLHSHMQKIL
jgi:hypothetical protein